VGCDENGGVRESDNNNNNDTAGDNDSYENDNISVTGSPDITNLSPVRGDEDIQDLDDDDSHRTRIHGAFTSLIQKNSQFIIGNKKSELISGFQHLHQPHSHQLPQQHMINHAALQAAQLFFQSPLLPQPGHWLYNQLYGNYSELPWFRQSLTNETENSQCIRSDQDSLHSPNSEKSVLSSIKKSSTLITSTSNVESPASPPPSVTSTKRSPSPILSSESDTLGKLQHTKLRKRSNSVESIPSSVMSAERRINTGSNPNNNSNSKLDVWRPY
jgi:hypothetical protein